MYSTTKRRKTKKGKPKKKVKGSKPVVPRLGGQKFAQQSIKESKRFSGTLLAGLPINTQTPAVTGLILEQKEIQQRETDKRREEIQIKRPELDLGGGSVFYTEPRTARYERPQPIDDDDLSTLTEAEEEEEERSELSGFRASVAERRQRRERGDPTMRNRPLSVQSVRSDSVLSASSVPMSLDARMELIRQAREDVGDESTVDRPFEIDEEMGERFYRATQETGTVTMPQRFTKTDVAKLNSSEFKEFASKRGIEINPNRGYRSGTTLRQEAVKLLFSGKKRGSTIV